ncbi:MAG: cytochrome c oxidase assembly protein [Acidimicrobiales bacterium]
MNSSRRLRDAAAVVGFALFFVLLVPPLATWARQYEFAQAIQFCGFAVVVPALVVAGAPWRRLGLSVGPEPVVGEDGAVVAGEGWIDRRWARRLGRTGHARAVTAGLIAAGLVILWRSAPVVDLLVRDPWMEVVEAVTLVGAGIALWVDLIESPPLRPATTRPYRIGLAAVSMWVVWVVAYFNGMSHSSWYGAFHHVAGHGLSLMADQQFTAGVMWLLSASAFIPVVFWNLVHWLASEDDPDEELHRLVRDERTRGFHGSGN